MTTTARSSRTLSVSIDAPFDCAWQLIADPRTLHLWTVDFALAPPRPEGALYKVQTPRGELDLFVESDRRSGVIDFNFGRDGHYRRSPSRLLRNDDGVVYVFTIFAPDDGNAATLERLAGDVEAELQRLRELLEER